MAQLLAACGTDCSGCEAYIAAQANDRAAQERVLAKWRVDYQMPDMPFEAVICDGCMTDGRHGGYCGECAVRGCAVERGVLSCAHCDDFACSKIEGFMAQGPEVRANLEGIRASLQH